MNLNYHWLPWEPISAGSSVSSPSPKERAGTVAQEGGPTHQPPENKYFFPFKCSRPTSGVGVHGSTSITGNDRDEPFRDSPAKIKESLLEGSKESLLKTKWTSIILGLYHLNACSCWSPFPPNINESLLAIPELIPANSDLSRCHSFFYF